MKAIRKKDQIFFMCKGCKHLHAVNKGWEFNEDYEKPSFKPSILVKSYYGEESVLRLCHSHVTDGKIQYLADSTHYLAGKTVELSEISENDI